MTAMTQPRDGGDMKWPNAFRLLADHSTQVSLTYVVRRHIGLDFRRLLVGASKPRCCWWSIDHKLWIISCQLFIKIVWNDFKKSSFIKFQSDHDIEFWVISEQAVSMTWPMTPPTSHSCEPVHLGNTSLVSWEFCLRGCHQSVRQLAGQLWLGVRSSKSSSFWVWNYLKLLSEFVWMLWSHSTFFLPLPPIVPPAVGFICCLSNNRISRIGISVLKLSDHFCPRVTRGAKATNLGQGSGRATELGSGEQSDGVQKF